MNSPRNPVDQMIQKNCHAISAANHVALRKTADYQHQVTARATIDALEGLTIDLIDQSDNLTKIALNCILCTGSLRLAQHIHQIDGKKIVYYLKQWESVLAATSTTRVRELTSGPATVAHISKPLIDAIGQGRDDLIPLIEDVAAKDPFPTTEIAFLTNAPAASARLLQLQADRMPALFHDKAIDAARQMGVDSLALLFKLGVKMPDPDMSYSEGTAFLKALSTNHGRIYAHAVLGSLEGFIADKKRHQRSALVSKYVAEHAC